jgi:LysR family transcriptional regulator, nitrogen assimilation regulatory protein
VDIRQLRYFIAVARSGSLTAASQSLRVSQPALGYQIKKLEDLLDVDLFARHSRGVALTEAGRKLLRHAEAIVERIRSAEEAMRPFQKKLSGDLSLGVTPTSGRILAPEILSRCAEETRLRVAVYQAMSHDLLRRVEAGTLDLAFCYDADDARKVNAIRLYREKLFLIGPPGIVDSNKTVSFDELRQYPLLLDNRFQVIRQRVERVARKRAIRLNVMLEVEPINLKREMLIRNRCGTVVPYGLFLDDIKAGQLNAREIARPALIQSLHLIYRRNLNEAVAKFIVTIVKVTVARKIAEGALHWESP